MTLDSLVLLDVTVLEPESSEPEAVHDLHTTHEIGFSAAAGWREPVDDGGVPGA